MTEALSGGLRSALEGVVQDARLWVEGDLGSSLGGRFGINADGVIEPESALSLSNVELAVRRGLVEIVEFLRAEGEDDAGSVGRLVREAAFTQVNRLVAVRVAEAVGLLPETMGRGLASSGFRDFSELAPTVAETEWGRFAVLVGLCADELAADVPALFDPRNPLLELPVSEPVFADVVEAIAGLGDEVWGAPDALGWAYQFFNTGEERREMRESSAPRNSRELAVRNQFFTPSYVVEFLVQNGLGAYLASGFPGLVDEFELLVEVPAERREVDLGSVSVLDPACGSGHFLLGAYEALEAAWRHAGVEPGDAAPAIVSSLWGIDIDPRAAQIAQAAVMFRARRHCRSGVLPVANVICARALPAGPEVDAFVGSLPDHTARVVRAVSDELVSAPVLGPLLKIEQRLDREARDVFGTGVIEGTLSEVAASQDEVDVLAALSTIADTTTSSPAQRLFAAEAHDAVRFVEAMNCRYTAVLMNPPFGEPVAETKTYLKTAYPASPPNQDLFAAFVSRGIELAQEGEGSCGAITNRSGLFLGTFEKWRRHTFLTNRLSAFVDLGLGVMEQALVEAAAYVVSRRPSSGPAPFISLLRERDRSSAIESTALAAKQSDSDERVFPVDLQTLGSMPKAALSYWLDPRLVAMHRDFRSVGDVADVCSGLSTGDDFRFVRAFWETDGENIAEWGRRPGRWVPFAKGGPYSPFWADIHLVLDWKDSGQELKDFDGSYFRNPDKYFMPGLTWSVRTASGFSPRLLPEGCVFGHKGNFVGHPSLGYVLATLMSPVATASIGAQLPAADETTSGGASKSYEVGVVRNVPFPPVQSHLVSTGAIALARVVAQRDRFVETSRRFVAPRKLSVDRSDRLLVLEEFRELLNVIAADYGVQIDEMFSLSDSAPYPLDYPSTNDIDDEVARLFTASIEEVIEEMVQRRGGRRELVNQVFVADRRVEVIAHGLQVSAAEVVRVANSRGLAAPGEAENAAFGLVSYLVGVGFGRWDVRIGADPSLAVVPEDLLAPPARYSPGMLLDESGRPPLSAPEHYPVDFPADGVLVDQSGHRWDLAERVALAAIELTGSTDELESVLAVLMKRPSLEGFLRSQFFKSHLSMYSMSRRQAPIYWQLQVPSKAWGVWLYAPKLSREMLFGVAREAERRLRLAEQQIGHLERESHDGGGGRRAADVAKELEAEQKLAVELETFRAEAERIAGLGWEPDLDDGMVLNAAPLASLFPAWKDAEKYRKELKAGKYEWATVAQFADQL